VARERRDPRAVNPNNPRLMRLVSYLPQSYISSLTGLEVRHPTGYQSKPNGSIDAVAVRRGPMLISSTTNNALFAMAGSRTR